MNLIDKFQEVYKGSNIFTIFQQILGDECDRDNADYKDLLNQFFISSATWGLYKWEEFRGIPTPDNTVDIETRRSNIIASLRGRETTTKNKIRVVAESYANGTCEVIEDNANYMFYIKFTGSRGIPKRIDELSKSIDRIKPAHLRYEFIFSYLTWNDFDGYNKTWDNWDNLNLTWDSLEAYI